MIQVCLSLMLWWLPAWVIAHEQVIDLRLQDLTLPRYEYTPAIEDDERVEFSHGGRIRGYFLYVPRRTAASPPVLFALHAAGRTGATMVDSWAATAEKHGIIVLAPEAAHEDWNAHQDGSDFLLAALDHARQRRYFTPGPLYLFGHASGGRKVLALAATTPGLFRSMATHSSTLADPLPMASRHVRPGRLGLFIGDSDPLHSVAAARKTRDWLSAGGLATRLYILQHHGHWYYTDARRINESVWAFMTSP